MPLGNGSIGLNVWVEPNGDLVFYIGHTDAWSAHCRLLKVGRVRISMTPNPIVPNGQLRQELHPADGEFVVRGGSGAPLLCLWVDANRPVVNLDVSSEQEITVTARLEVWRTTNRQIEGRERASLYGFSDNPEPVSEEPDTIVASRGDQLIWYHRNTTSVWRETLAMQGLSSFAEGQTDPLLGLTFGALLRGPGLVRRDSATLSSATASRRHTLHIHVLAQHTSCAEEWIELLRDQAVRTERTHIERARREHRSWWSAFWDRSWISVEGDESAKLVTQAYALQRFISACGGRGGYPIKFNGSIFNVDAREDSANPEHREFFDADYRRWGGPYWFQNTRLMYWPMLATGDWDSMGPFFRMYREAIPLALARTKEWFGHGGAFFPETMYFWGSHVPDNYGWDRIGKHVSHVDNTYIRWYWSGGLELLAIMLDYQVFHGGEAFLTETLLPTAEAILTFYGEHYSLGPDGRVRFEPAEALETWQKAIDPLPEIAGLGYVLDRLTTITSHSVPDSLGARWRALRAVLPKMPTSATPDGPVLAPAWQILEEKKNCENVELYAVFPYRVYGVGKPHLEMARRTFAQRAEVGAFGWRQDDTQAAFLGLADEARTMLSARASYTHAGSRFPAFWGPNADWIPDQTHGGNLMMTLQTMLLQHEGDKVLLLPAWPREWNVSFRLRAPHETTVEMSYRDGKAGEPEVTPPHRRKDVKVVRGDD
jgi:hypothetical protein